jgi:uncharacterized protein (TIGR02246 family)
MRTAQFVLLVLATSACSKGESKEADKDNGKGKVAPIKSGGSQDDRKAIDQARTAFAQNYSAGDGKRVASIYTPDAVMMQNSQPAIVGGPAISEFVKAQFEMAYIELTLSSAEVVFIGDGWAFDRGTYRSIVRIKESGEVDDDDGNYLVLWRRQADGSWKIARDIDATSRPEK